MIPNLEEIKKLTSKGRIFTVEFIKKDGSKRKIVCRRGVRRYVTGVGLRFSPDEKNLLTVFDMVKGEYRNIPWNRVQKVQVNKKQYIQ